MLDKEYIKIIQEHEKEIKNGDFIFLNFLNDPLFEDRGALIKFFIVDCDIDLKKYSRKLNTEVSNIINGYYLTNHNANSKYAFYDKNKNLIKSNDIKTLHDTAFYVSVDGNDMEPLNGKIYHLSDKYGCLVYDEELYQWLTGGQAMELGKNGFHLANIIENDLLRESEYVDGYSNNHMWSSVEHDDYSDYYGCCSLSDWMYSFGNYERCCVLVKSF